MLHVNVRYGKAQGTGLDGSVRIPHLECRPGPRGQVAISRAVNESPGPECCQTGLVGYDDTVYRPVVLHFHGGHGRKKENLHAVMDDYVVVDKF